MAEHNTYIDSQIPYIGEIPANWRLGRVKEAFCAVKTIVGDESEKYERLALTLKGVIKRSKTEAGGLQPEQFETYQILRENELVFKLIDLQNTATSRVGRSPYTGIVSPAYIVLRDRKNRSTRYAEYYFLYMWMHHVFNQLGADGVRSSMGSTALLNLPYPIVPEKEQEAIGEFLDQKCSQINALIDEASASIEEYKAWKSSIIFEIVTKGLDPKAEMKESGIEYIGKIPASWGIKKLRNIGTPQNGISKSGDSFGQGYPFVSYGDVYRNFSLPAVPSGLVSSTEEERLQYSVEEGDIFFTRTSETIEEVGFSCVCEETIPNATFAGFLIRVRPHTNDLLTGFAKYYFRSPHHRAYFAREMNLVTRASLSQGLLKSMPVVIPPKKEQKEIADFLDHKCAVVDALITEKQKLIADLEAYKKSLIFEVVTGKRKAV